MPTDRFSYFTEDPDARRKAVQYGRGRDYLELADENRESDRPSPKDPRIVFERKPHPTIANTTTYKIYHIDGHSFGPMLVNELRRSPKIFYAGYREPHPSEHEWELRLTTVEKADHDKVLHDAADKVWTQSKRLLHTYTLEMTLKQQMRKLKQDAEEEAKRAEELKRNQQKELQILMGEEDRLVDEVAGASRSPSPDYDPENVFTADEIERGLDAFEESPWGDDENGWDGPMVNPRAGNEEVQGQDTNGFKGPLFSPQHDEWE